ncbi:MAG: beta strand repeat-containing protein, partial [Salibacteraceae bacterium]
MRKLGLLLLLFVLGFQSRATHISGADFNYTCIGQDSFYITLNLFRDCSGIASPNNANVTFTSTCGQSFSVQLTKQNGQFGEEISQLCPGDISNSTCNGGPLIGMQHYIYGGVVVLSPPCDTWTMQWSLCCRNTTVNLVGQPEMLVEATLNSATDSCNNSPVFNAQPILYVCLNQNVNYNFGISEADGDSLVYQFVTPKDEIVGGNVQPVPFSPGYSYTQPIAGISLSTTTGQLQFTPTIAGNFVLAVEVCEYDYATGLLQGCVIRDIQFIVIPCANQAPTPPVNGISSFTGTGMQVSNDSVLICEGNSFSFDIVFTDADTGDSVTLTTNLATVLPGASFSFSHGNPATMTVSGIATAAMANYNAFYVHAVDDACPISAFGTHSYFILTQPKPTVFAGGNSIMCHDQASVPISGSIQDAGGGIWSGNGTFGQATTNLNNEYYPTTAEIAAGSASVVLTSTGNQNCDPVSDTLVIQITQFNEPFTPGYSPVKCSSGTDGKAFISHTFSSPISITWNTNPVQYGDSALNLTSGSYTATLVDSNGCDTSVVIVVPEPTEIATSITFLSHVFCTGGNDGQATINAIGGVSPYTYNWPASANNQTTATGSNLFAGVYVVTITDSNLCYTTETVTILEPNFPLNLVVSTTDVSCFGGNDGSAEAFPTGGTAPYSYTWGPNNQTTNPITNVSSGTYSVTVVDNSGMCVVQTGIIIDEPDPIGGSNTSLNVLCDGGNTGVLGFVPSGGTMPFSYQWGGAAGGATSSTVANMGAGAYPLSLIDSLGCRFDTIVNLLAPTILTATGNSTTTLCKDASNGTASVTPSGGVSPYVVSWNDINSQTGLTAVNLLAGSYIATIIDSNGCDTSVTVVVSEPDSLTGTIVSQSNVNCTGGVDGVVQVSGLGGTSPYSYLWDTNANNQTTAVADSLSAGSYDVTITDANGCFYVLNVVITEPFYPLVLSVTATNISCYGAANGTVSVSAAGGTNPYQYSWSPSGQTTSTITNLDESTNTVTVTDNSGQCIVQSGISITQPDTLSTVAVITDVLCNSGNTGEAQISTKGGTKPYSITWNAAAGGQTDSLATNLTAGTFAFTITDSNNCQYDSTVTLTQPSALSMSSLDSIPKCFNGADGNIQVFGYGGNAPYSFTWDANASNQTDSIATGLSTGFYTVTLTDSNSCTLDSTFFLNQPTPVSTSSITLEHIGCFGDSTGTATIIATGGASPYEYVWNTSSNLENSGGVFGLWADTYFLTITDSNGCVFDTNIIINQPAFPLGVDSIISDVACFGDSTGFIESIATGGTAPYVYLWDSAANNQTSAIATNLAIGSYQVWVVDSNGCQDSLMATINQPVQALGVSVLESNVLCFGESNGYAVATGFGGTVPYSYQWGSGTVNQVGDSATNLPQGSYSVTITDTLGCMVDTAIIINEPQPLTINSSSLV